MGFFDSIWSGIKSVGVKLQNGVQHYAKVGKEVLHKGIQVVRPLKQIALNLKPLGFVGNNVIDGAVGLPDVVDNGLQSASNWLDDQVK